jgi:hypothetical protein
MIVDIAHAKNPAAGWDVDVTVTAEGKETVAHVRIDINGFTKCDEEVSPAARRWHRQLPQQGEYPGDNSVVATATDGDGEDTTSVDEWS